jgi:hypothetical protein
MRLRTHLGDRVEVHSVLALEFFQHNDIILSREVEVMKFLEAMKSRKMQFDIHWNGRKIYMFWGKAPTDFPFQESWEIPSKKLPQNYMNNWGPSIA